MRPPAPAEAREQDWVAALPQAPGAPIGTADPAPCTITGAGSVLSDAQAATSIASAQVAARASPGHADLVSAIPPPRPHGQKAMPEAIYRHCRGGGNPGPAPVVCL